MSLKHQVEAGNEEELSPIDQFLMVFQTFAENQEELLHVARYICSRQSDLDDARGRRLGELSRQYPELSYESLEQVWELVEKFLPDVAKDDDEPDETDIDPEHDDDATTSVDDTTSAEAEDDDTGEAFARTISAILEIIPEDYLQPIMDAIFHSRNDDRKHSPRVLSSLLVNAFTEFEVLVGNLLTTLFNQNEQATPTATKYSWKEIAEFASIEEFKTHVLSEAVTGIMYGGYESWLGDLKKTFGIVSPPFAEQFPVLEAIQRRHLIVHNASYVSQQYIDKLKDKGDVSCSVGDRLMVDENYLMRAADLFWVTALCLTEAAARKTIKKDADSIKELEIYIGNQLYELLQQRRYDAIADFAQTCQFDNFQSASNALVCKVNYWLALKRLGKFDLCRAEVRAWETTILGKEYKLARLALLDETDEALELVREIRGSEELPIYYWATWPLLEELRAAEIEAAKRSSHESDAAHH